MKKSTIIWIIAIVVIVLGVWYLSSSNKPASTPATNPVSNEIPISTTFKTTTTPKAPVPAVSQIVHNVSITGFAFVPASITVRKGETIVWTNKDATTHTVTGGDLQSLHLSQNQTYSFAYDKTGVFPYHCSIHPSMKGTITVTN